MSHVFLFFLQVCMNFFPFALVSKDRNRISGCLDFHAFGVSMFVGSRSNNSDFNINFNFFKNNGIWGTRLLAFLIVSIFLPSSLNPTCVDFYHVDVFVIFLLS